MTEREELAAQLRRQLCETGRYMMANGLAWGNAGNISARISPDEFLITASGTDLGELKESDFARSETAGSLSRDSTHQDSHRLATQAEPGSPKPSKEVPMHRAVYEERPDIGAVLHASPLYSTLFACSREAVPADWFVETMYYLERVERVAYAHPGSAELGEAVRKQARKANILLLDNHGVLVYDTTLKEARMALHTLEMACRMAIEAKKAEIPVHALQPETVAHFLEHSGYRPRRKWMT